MIRALMLIDLQRDFCPGGSMAVKDGQAVIAVANRLAALAAERGLLVLASRDWHPENHCSFKTEGGIWPVHCVAETPGADWHPELRLPKETLIIDKAKRSDCEMYSAFGTPKTTATLKRAGVTEVLVLGLATDYCVKNTVLDALDEELKVYVVTDGCRAVNAKPDDGAAALAEMTEAGALLITEKEALTLLGEEKES